MITDTLGDLMALLLRCASEWMAGGRATIALWLVCAFGGAVLSFFLALYWCRLWNRSHSPRLLEWSGALLLTVLTFISIVLWPTLGLIREATSVSIDVWKLQIASDVAWQSATFSRAYEAVKELGVEDFSTQPSDIPIKHRISVEKMAAVYSQAALEHFAAHWPLLYAVLRPDRSLSEDKIADAVSGFFNSGGDRYTASNAVEIAATHLAIDAEIRAPRLVTLSRALLVAAWACATGIILALLGWLAFRSLS